MPVRRPRVAGLWAGQLGWVATGQSRKDEPEAGRLLAVFVDYLSSRVRDASWLMHLLSKHYWGVLTHEERELAQALGGAGGEVGRGRAAFPRLVRDWLAGLSYSPGA